MSWIPLANKSQAHLDSSGNPLPDVTDNPLTLEDSTTGRKQINIIYDSSCNKYHLIHLHCIQLYHYTIHDYQKHLNN